MAGFQPSAVPPHKPQLDELWWGRGEGGKTTSSFFPGPSDGALVSIPPSPFFLTFFQKSIPLLLPLRRVGHREDDGWAPRAASLGVNLGERAFLMRPNNFAPLPGGAAFAGFQAERVSLSFCLPPAARSQTGRCAPAPARGPRQPGPARAPRGGERLGGGIINN